MSRGAAEIALTKMQRQADDDQHPKTKITVHRAVEQWLDLAHVPNNRCRTSALLLAARGVTAGPIAVRAINSLGVDRVTTLPLTFRP
jgi:hypothetical protein